MKKALTAFLSLAGVLIWIGTTVAGLPLSYGSGDSSNTNIDSGVLNIGFSFTYYGRVVMYGRYYPDGDLFFQDGSSVQGPRICAYFIPSSANSTIWYRHTNSSNDFSIINNFVVAYSSGLFSGFEATNAVVVTWNGIYNTANIVQTIFQFVAVTDGYLSFFIMNFERCSLNYSGCFIAYPTSSYSNLTASPTFTNINTPGTYVQRVDGYNISNLLLVYGPSVGDPVATVPIENVPLSFQFNYFSFWMTYVSFYPWGDVYFLNANKTISRRLCPYYFGNTTSFGYGKMYNRSVTNTSDLSAISSLVTQASSLYASFETTIAYSVTWYLNYANKLNIFQSIIATNGTTTYLIYGFALLTSPPILNGYSYMDGSLPNTTNTNTGTNCGKAGHYVYRVDSGTNLILPFRYGDTQATSTTLISLGFCFNFYGVLVNQGNVQTNGQFLSVNGSVNVGTITPLLVSGVTKANMFYRQVTNSTELSIINAKVAQFNAAYSSFSAANAHVTTWSQFVSFTQNVFQMIIVTDGNSSFLLFSYGLISSTSTSSSFTAQNGTSVSFSPTMFDTNFGSSGQYIYKVDSLTPTMKISNSYQSSSSPQKVNRSATISFNPSSSLICSCTYTTTYEWSVYNYDATSNQIGSQVTFSVNPTLTMATFVIPANTLNYGVYIVKLTATVTVNGLIFQYTTQDYTYLNIVPTGITVMVIENALTSVTIGSLQSYVLDPVSHSIDLDNVKTITSLTFKYYCQLVSNTSSGLNYVLSGGATDLATGVTTNTCFSSTSGYTISSTAKTLTIKSGGMVYQSGKVNQFVISTTSNGYTYYQVVRINLNEQIPELPVPSISCLVLAFCVTYGNYKIFNPSNILTLEGSYSGARSSITSASYRWTVFRNTGNSSIPIWTSLTTSEQSKLDGVATSELTISSDLFTNSFQQFIIQLTLSTTSSVVALNANFSTNMIMQSNQLPYGGQCAVDMSSGLALDTYFTITCSDWADNDGIVIRYEFFALTSADKSVNLGNNQTGYFYTQLPTGSATDSNRLYIFVQVFDNSGGITHYNISTAITVTMSSSTMTSSINDMLSGSSSSPLVQSITGASDLSVASSAIIAFSSSFNQAISGSNLSSNESAQLVTQAQQINQKMVDAIKTFDLTDMSSIKAASSALSVVSATPALVSPDTATQVVSMCADMTNSMVTAGAKFGLSFIFQAASFILDASANSLESLNSQSSSPSTLKTAATQQIGLVQTITSITAKQLAVNGSKTVTKDNINLTISRNSMKDVYTSVETNGISMGFDNPCAIVGKPAGSCSNQFAIQQIFSRANSLSLNSDVDTSSSGSVSVSYFNPDMTKLSVSTSSTEGFYFWIPQSVAGGMFFEPIDIDNSNISSQNQLYTLKADLKTPNMSVIFEILPNDTTSTGYLLTLSYEQIPIITSSKQVYDSIHIFCPPDLKTENGSDFYKLFSGSAENKVSASYVGFGIRELTQSEFSSYCTLKTVTSSIVPILSDTYNFTTAFSSPVSYMAFGLGCYYIQEPEMQYSSWGIETLSDSNSTHTHCVATHLTEFAGSMSSMVVLPEPIDFNNVWSKADFTSNLTIYLTVIIVSCLYILLFVWCRYMDWKDNKKRMIYLLADNNPRDIYFYEMLVYTGARRDAGTNSHVSFILSGQNGDSGIRNLRPESTNGNKILQRGSVNSFIFSHKSPLGALSYLRVWHDNSDWSRNASWFLKFVIVHDLQNREKFYFICNNWLGVDKSDGLIDRILFLATRKEKTDMSYLMEKQTKEKLSDGHLWLSIVARPTMSSFSRTDRLTCAFVLLFLSMLMNIMYYGMSSSSSTTNQLVLGPFSLSQTQIIIGVIANLVIFPPSFLIMQIFRKSRRRTTRSAKLQQNIQKALSDELEITAQQEEKKEPISLKKKKKRKPFSLPWWFKIIGYVLSFCIVTVCLFFIILRGISFGDETCRQWLTSFLISVITSVCFTQPLQVILLSIFFVLLFRKTNGDRDIEADHEDNGKAINKYYRDQTVTRNDEDDENGMNSFKREFDSDNPSQLAEARKQRAVENKAWEAMRMILIYGIFLTVLFQVAYSKTSPLSYGYQTRLQSLVLQNITKVKTTEDVWSWLNDQFIDSMLGVSWYNGDSTQLDSYIKDYSSYLVGKIMLRQARVKVDSCLRTVNSRSTCYPDYSAGSYENRNYGLGWSTLSLPLTTPPSEDVQKAFQYSSAFSIDSQPYASLYKTYLGGGYVYQINTSALNLSQIQSEFSSLQENEWIDQKTRALFIEFTLYNVNVDLFAYCLILFEILPLGSIVITYEFDPMSLYTDQSALIVAFDIVYLFIIVFFLLKEIKLMIKLKKKYLTNWWSYVNWILIAFSWVSFAMYMYRMYEKYNLMKKLKASTTGDQVVNFQTMQYWNSLLLMFLAFCCFTGSVKLLKVFSFSRHINMLVNVFHRVFKEMLSFIVMFLILVFAFTQVMYLMVYDRNSQFMSFSTSIVTGFLIMLGKFNIDSFCQDAGEILGPITYCIFAVTVIMVLLNMFITLLTDSFSQIRKEYNEVSDEDSLLLAYFKTKILPLIKNTVSFGKKKNKTNANPAGNYVETLQSLEIRTDDLMHAIKYKTRANKQELKD